MASVIREKSSGRRRIEFYNERGARKRVRLGDCNQKQAEAVRSLVEKLAAARATGHPAPPAVAAALAELSPKIRVRIARAGLADAQACPALGDFLDAYIDGRRPMKPRTESILLRTRSVIVQHFGADRELGTITRADAEAWRRWLAAAGRHGGGALAPNSVANHVKRAKLFFRAAVDGRLIAENPFDRLPSAINGNPDRRRFVTLAEAAAVLRACPDADWRALFALSRFGGLRCPSETLALRWADVNFPAGRLTIRAAKTGQRDVPLFPELLRELKAARAAAAGEFVIRQRSHKNLRKGLLGIVRRAGLEPWPRLFHNLRASRQTELAARFPAHVVCAWLGNSPRVAFDHYLTVTEADFAEARKAARKAAR